MAYTTINKSTDYFNTKLYTGNGSTQSITGVGFQPDWTWIKHRNGTGWHNLFDVNRGATKSIYTNRTEVEGTYTNSLTSFDSDGFSLGNSGDVNGSTRTYVGWNWLAGGTASSNTDGSITSNVSANTTAGFSIIDFTGNETNSTVGHGLGVAPSMFIMKRYTDDGYSSTTAWYTYHKSLASDKYLDYKAHAAVATNDGSLWNTSTPVTSSVINIGFNANSNHTGNKTIIYAFAEKTGYSKFGSYTGNGNADGTFVYTGFKPAFVMVDNTQQADDWYMFDNKRSSYNQVQANLKPNTNSAEASSTSYAFDFLSNGFKVRASTGAINNNNEKIIYMAFAEAPLVGSNGVTAKAR